MNALLVRVFSFASQEMSAVASPHIPFKVFTLVPRSLLIVRYSPF